MAQPTRSDGGVAPSTDDRFEAVISRTKDAFGRWTRRWEVAHALSLVLAAGFLMLQGRRQWFFYDEWDAIANRSLFGGNGKLGWMDPHSEHPFLLGNVFYRGLLHIFGLRTYVPFIAAVLLAHLIVCHLVWRLCVRAGARVSVATCVVGLFAVCGAGYENLLWAFQMTIVGSVAAGLAALLMIRRRNGVGAGDVVASALLIISVLFSGVGLTMAVAAAVAALAYRRWVAAMVIVAPCLVVYLGFVARYGHGVANAPTAGQGLRHAPEFAFVGLSDALGDFVAVRSFGPGLLLLLLVGLGWVLGSRLGPLVPVVAVSCGSFIFIFLAGVRRFNLGIDTAGSSRYEYVMLALLLPAAVVVFNRIVDVRPVIVPALLGLTLVLGIAQVQILSGQSHSWSERSSGSRHLITAAANAIRSGEVTFQGQVEPQWAPDLDVEELRELVKADWMPHVEQGAATDYAAQNLVQVAVLPATQSEVPLGGIALIGAPSGAVVTSGCVTLQAPADTAQLDVRTAGAVELKTASSVRIHVLTGGAGSDELFSPVREFKLAPGVEHLALGHIGAVVRVAVPDGGPLSVCSLDRG